MCRGGAGRLQALGVGVRGGLRVSYRQEDGGPQGGQRLLSGVQGLSRRHSTERWWPGTAGNKCGQLHGKGLSQTQRSLKTQAGTHSSIQTTEKWFHDWAFKGQGRVGTHKIESFSTNGPQSKDN